jgi:hypothetical protein
MAESERKSGTDGTRRRAGTETIPAAERGIRRPGPPPSPAAMTALLALAKADTILLWDPAGQTLIAANIAGTWLAPTGVALGRGHRPRPITTVRPGRGPGRRAAQQLNAVAAEGRGARGTAKLAGQHSRQAAFQCGTQPLLPSFVLPIGDNCLTPRSVTYGHYLWRNERERTRISDKSDFCH